MWLAWFSVASSFNAPLPPHTQGQRTVYRLTIVKEWNDDEARGYAELVKLGEPDFIEVKVRPGEMAGSLLFWSAVLHSPSSH